MGLDQMKEREMLDQMKEIGCKDEMVVVLQLTLVSPTASYPVSHLMLHFTFFAMLVVTSPLSSLHSIAPFTTLMLGQLSASFTTHSASASQPSSVHFTLPGGERGL